METYAKEILRQLGGNKFIAMTGASCFFDGKYTLIVKFKGSKIANIVSITLNGLDLYDVKFSKYRNLDVKDVKVYNNVYADMLTELFEKTTGLRTFLY